MRIHRLATVSVTVAMLALSAGCTKPAGGSSSTPAATGAGVDQKVASRSSATCTNHNTSSAKLSGMVVGFSQSENEQNPFRATETDSIKAAAKSASVQRLLYANANDNQAKQVADVQSMINQGAKALIVAPINATGLQPAFAAAAAKGIPVVTIDRLTAGTFCKDFITFMGSNFHEQGVRAGKALVKATGGKANVVELQGAYGNDVETARTKGFAEAIKPHPGVHLVAAQTANWSTSEAQSVMGQLLSAHPNVNAVYTQSDTMAVGAMTAIQHAKKKPGSDVKIVSIDGTKELVQGIANGTVAADVQTNPRFGPAAFAALADWFAGKPVAQKIIMQDEVYTKDNAKQALASGSAY